MKISILLLLMLANISSYSQFNKGDKYIGGTLNVNSGSSSTTGTNLGTSTTSSLWEIGPTVGFFLNNKRAFGFTLGYSYSTSLIKTATGGTAETTSKGLTSSIFLKQFFTISDNFYFTFSGAIGFSRHTSITPFPPNESDDYSVTVGVAASFIFFPSPQWSFEAGLGGLGYRYTRTLPNEGDYNNFGLSLSSDVNFAINYYFRKSE